MTAAQRTDPPGRPHGRSSATVLLLLFAAACGDAGRDRAAADAPRALDERAPVIASSAAVPDDTAVTAAVTSAGASTGGGCPMFGPWRRCSVEERLRSAGWAPELVADSVRQRGLAITGTAYQIGHAELQVFLYADSSDARREAAAMEPRRAETAATRGIRRPPAVIHTNNLVALFFSNNDRLLERVQLALTAGLPAA